MKLHHKHLNIFIKLFFSLITTGMLFEPKVLRAQEIEDMDLTVSSDYGVSNSMVTKLPDYADFSDLREADYAKMSLDDQRLQSVYVRLFDNAIGYRPEYWRLQDHIRAAYHDLKRRGNEVTPTLLKLMHDNPDSPFEAAALEKIQAFENMDVTPYLEYARELVETRHQTMNPVLAACAATLLMRRGDETDVQRLRDVITKRPYLTYTIESKLKMKQMEEAGVNVKSKVTETAPLSGKNEMEPKASREAVTDSDQHMNGWWIYALAGVVGVGLLCFFYFRKHS